MKRAICNPHDEAVAPAMAPAVALEVRGLPPSPGKNRRLAPAVRRARDGHSYQGQRLTPQARAWMDTVAWQVRFERNRLGLPVDYGPRPWVALIIVQFTRTFDVDAPGSLAQDALEAGLGINDAAYALSLCVKRLVPLGTPPSLSLRALLAPGGTEEEWQLRTALFLPGLGDEADRLL